MVGLVREGTWVMILHSLDVVFDRTLATMRVAYKRQSVSRGPPRLLSTHPCGSHVGFPFPRNDHETHYFKRSKIMNDPHGDDIEALLSSTSETPEDTADAAAQLHERVQTENQRSHTALARNIADAYLIILLVMRSDEHYRAVVDQLQHKDPSLKPNGQKRVLTIAKLIFGCDPGTADHPEYKTASRWATMLLELIARRVSAEDVLIYLEDKVKPEHLLKAYRGRKAAADGAVAIEIIGEDPHAAWRKEIAEQGLVELCVVGMEEQIRAFEASSGRSAIIRTEAVETPGAPRALKLVRIETPMQNSPAAQQRPPTSQSTLNRAQQPVFQRPAAPAKSTTAVRQPQPHQPNSSQIPPRSPDRPMARKPVTLPPGLRGLSNPTSGARNGVNARKTKDTTDEAEWD